MLEYNSPLSVFHELHPERHREMHDSMQKLAEKAGLPKPKLVTINTAMLGDDLNSLILKSAPAGTFMKGDTHHIFFNADMTHMFGMASLDAPVTEELKAVIAHELGHIKRGDTVGFGTAKIASITPWACLIAGLGVTAYLRHRNEKKKEAELVDRSPENAELRTLHSPTLEAAKCVGQYLLGAIAGTGVGIGLATFLRHRMEYSCDAFSKNIMGSGEPLARALENFEKCNTELLEELAKKRKLSPQTVENIKKFCGIIERLFHPSIEKRAAALRGA